MMANETIHDQAETTSAAAADELALWVAASSVLRRITKANLLGGSLTGGGVLATGGYTLTVPATGTVDLLGTAQTISAAKTFSALATFSAGISLGNETLSLYDQGTWSPVITGSTSDPTATYSTQIGVYTRIGNVCFYSFRLIIASISGGSGLVRVSLPVAATATFVFGEATTGGAAHPATEVINLVFYNSGAKAYGIFQTVENNGSGGNLDISGLTNGDQLNASGFYFTS